jgi:hypothetical protein
MGHLIIYCNGLIVAARGWTAETRRLCERCFAHRYYLSCGKSGEHPEARFVRRLSFIQLLHQVARRRKPPQIRFFRSLPGTKGIQSFRILLPCGDKAHDWPSPATRGKLLRPCGQPAMPMPMPTSRLAFVENCIGSWLTERKWRGNGRSAGGGAALGSPACCDNRARDALGRKPRCSRATDHRGPPRAIIYNFRRMRPPRLELTQ